jgi:hypothetical protein
MATDLGESKMLLGKRAAIAVSALAITMSHGGAEASSADDAVMRKITAMEARISALEAENAAYKAQLKPPPAVARSSKSLAPYEAPTASISDLDGHLSYAALPAGRSPSPFDGAYAGLTSGYEFQNNSSQATGAFSPLSSFERIQGERLGAIFGYNASSGPLLIGFEARAQYAFGRDGGSRNSTFGQSLPAWIGSCGPSCLPNSIVPSAFALTSQSTYSEVVERPFIGDISMRAGVVFDDWLVYGRAGVGAEYSRMTSTSDNRGVVTCNVPVVTGIPRGSVGPGGAGTYDYYVTGCGSTTSGASTATTTDRFTPTVTLAGGIEKNFGQMFARAEAELLVHFPALTATQVYYSPAVNLAVGYRF